MKKKNKILSTATCGLLLLFCFSFQRTMGTNEKNYIANSNEKFELCNVLDTVDYKKDYLLGKFNPAKHPDFAAIPTHLKIEAKKNESLYARKEVLKAFKQMAVAAKIDLIDLKILSSTRNFYQQKIIWEKKWKRFQNIKNKVDRAKKILNFSSMPGISRHHWGTDIDINNTEITYFNAKQGKAEYEWLVKNASKYGFYQVYTKKGSDRPEGYNEEKWHWSYTPTSKLILTQYLKKISLDDIKEFPGAETAKEIDVINKYAAGINPLVK